MAIFACMQEINILKSVIHTVNKTREKIFLEPVIHSYFCWGEKPSLEKYNGSMNKCHSAWDDISHTRSWMEEEKEFFFFLQGQFWCNWNITFKKPYSLLMSNLILMMVLCLRYIYSDNFPPPNRMFEAFYYPLLMFSVLFPHLGLLLSATSNFSYRNVLWAFLPGAVLGCVYWIREC